MGTKKERANAPSLIHIVAVFIDRIVSQAFLVWNFSFQLTSALVIVLFLISFAKTIHDSYFIIAIYLGIKKFVGKEKCH